MDINLEAYESKSSPGTAEKIGRVIDNAIEKIKKVISNLVKKIKDVVNKLIENIEKRSEIAEAKDQVKYIKSYFKDPSNYPDVEISYFDLSGDKFENLDNIVKFVEGVPEIYESFFETAKKEIADNTDPNKLDFGFYFRKATVDWYKSKMNGNLKSTDEFSISTSCHNPIVAVLKDYLYGDYSIDTISKEPMKLSEILKNTKLYSPEKLSKEYLEKINTLTDSLEKKLNKDLIAISNKYKDMYNSVSGLGTAQDQLDMTTYELFSTDYINHMSPMVFEIMIYVKTYAGNIYSLRRAICYAVNSSKKKNKYASRTLKIANEGFSHLIK